MAVKTTKETEVTADAVAMAPQKKPRTHTVKKNDTLRSIAAMYLGTTTRADEIARLNHLATPILPVGKTLRIPEK